MTQDTSSITDLINLVSSVGPNGLLVIAIIYFKRISDKRERERDDQIGKQEKRIADLETKQEESRLREEKNSREHTAREEKNTQEYKVLAERVTDVMDQTRSVMQQVLAKLEK